MQPLLPFQRYAVLEAAAEHAAGHRAVLVVAPTGAGKTWLAARGIIRPAVLRGERVLCVAHRREIVRQLESACRANSVRVGLILSGERTDPWAPVQIASMQTLLHRRLPPAELVVIDEAHHVAAETYRDLERAIPHARLVGLTATPLRADGVPLDPPFSSMVVAAQPAELVETGRLVPVREVDVGHDEADAGTAPDVVADAWLEHARGLRTVTFAASRAHGRAIARALRERGVRVRYVDGDTDLDARDRALDELRRHAVDVLVNVAVYTEGWNEPLLGAVQVARPYRTLTPWLQAAGRGLRPVGRDDARWCRAKGLDVPNKRELVLLDHGGNLGRHGGPLVGRDWD